MGNPTELDDMAGATAAETTILDWLAAQRPAMLALLEELVNIDSGSYDKAGVDRVGAQIRKFLDRHGIAHDTLANDTFGDGIRATVGTGANTSILLMGHRDTVFPRQEAARRPFRIDDGRAYGPGVADMKAGLVMNAFVLAAFARFGAPAPLVGLFTADEEIGSPSSRALIEAEAAGCSAALVLESAANDGALKTERKGTSLYQVRAVGRAAHAGLEPERGVNATVELAHQVLAVAGFGDPERGTSVTPTALSSGTTSNTVPAVGSFAVDVRMWDSVEQARVDAAMRSLLPVVPDVVLQVGGGPNRAPLSAEASAELFERASGLAALLGLAPLTGAAVGGASDGNFTAGVGTPTLDGLGAAGGGAHADDEHVRVAELPGRAALIAALIDDLLADAPAGSPGGTR
jgi:glutamate carboxypeptidase